MTTRVVHALVDISARPIVPSQHEACSAGAPVASREVDAVVSAAAIGRNTLINVCMNEERLHNVLLSKTRFIASPKILRTRQNDGGILLQIGCLDFRLPFR